MTNQIIPRAHTQLIKISFSLPFSTAQDFEQKSFFNSVFVNSSSCQKMLIPFMVSSSSKKGEKYLKKISKKAKNIKGNLQCRSALASVKNWQLCVESRIKPFLLLATL